MSWFKGCEEGVHKFEARYDEVKTPTDVRLKSGGGVDVSEFAEAFRRMNFEQRYVHDICVRCGKIVKRGD
jgi:hypothetical protein